MQVKPKPEEKHRRILSSGEKIDRALRSHDSLNFKGYFFGIGLGGSLVVLSRYCSPELKGAYVLYPEPGNFLLSRVVVRAMCEARSGVDCLMSLADPARFNELYAAVMSDEIGDARRPDRVAAPARLLELRTALFTGKTGPLNEEERTLLSAPVSTAQERERLESWCELFIATRAFEPLGRFGKSFELFQRFARRIELYCADPFDPVVIATLMEPRSTDRNGMLIYLSDYASSSASEDGFAAEQYRAELFERLIERAPGPAYFAYSHALGAGQLLIDSNPPGEASLACTHFGTDPTAVTDHERFEYLDSAEARRMVQVIADMVRSRGFRRILDVGCRLGLITDHLDESYQYYGFDIAPEVIEAARARVADRVGCDFRFEVGDWNYPPDIEADVIIFGGVFFYIGAYNRSRSAGDNAVRNRFVDMYLERYSPSQVIIQDLKETYLDAVRDRFPFREVALRLDIRHPDRRILDLTIKGDTD